MTRKNKTQDSLTTTMVVVILFSSLIIVVGEHIGFLSGNGNLTSSGGWGIIMLFPLFMSLGMLVSIIRSHITNR